MVLHHADNRKLVQLQKPAGSETLVVGPECGLAPEERAAVEGRGFVPVHLGPLVMGTETAPRAALGAMQTLWGDFRA
jgi:RNA methyltransferase, RsmE family